MFLLPAPLLCSQYSAILNVLTHRQIRTIINTMHLISIPPQTLQPGMSLANDIPFVKNRLLKLVYLTSEHGISISGKCGGVIQLFQRFQKSIINGVERSEFLEDNLAVTSGGRLELFQKEDENCATLTLLERWGSSLFVKLFNVENGDVDGTFTPTSMSCGECDITEFKFIRWNKII